MCGDRAWKRRALAELAAAAAETDDTGTAKAVTAVPYNEEGTQFKMTLNGITVIV